MTPRPVAVAAGVLVTAFLAAYLPDLGHGFVQDDFRWIRESRVTSVRELPALFATHIGFYRPLVSVSFALDHALWGLEARAYAASNLLLLATCAVLLFNLARRFGLAAAPALLTTAVWAFNLQGINMALLWISGRTALLVTLFALATAHAVLARRTWLAGGLCLAALLCKEEAVLLPALFSMFAWLDAAPATGRARLLDAARRTWALWASLAVYVLLRAQSGAIWPGDAPPFYRFSVSPGVILVNAAHYADRALTVAAGVVLLLLLVVRRRPHLTPAERHALILAAVWIPATYALTTLVPVRSSLYAVLPSAGSALAAGAVAAALQRAAPRAFERGAAVLVILAVVLVPVYRGRNARWVTMADISAQALDTVARHASGAATRRLVLVDAPDERFNLDTAFGGLLGDALALRLGEEWHGEIVTPAAPLPADGLHFLFDEGSLHPLPPR